MQSAQNISASHFTRGSDTKLKLYQSLPDSNITFSTENNLLTEFQEKTTVNYVMYNLR